MLTLIPHRGLIFIAPEESPMADEQHREIRAALDAIACHKGPPLTRYAARPGLAVGHCFVGGASITFRRVGDRIVSHKRPSSSASFAWELTLTGGLADEAARLIDLK